MQQIYGRTLIPKCNFNKVTGHGCSPVNLLHIFRTPSFKEHLRRAASENYQNFLIFSLWEFMGELQDQRSRWSKHQVLMKLTYGIWKVLIWVKNVFTSRIQLFLENFQGRRSISHLWIKLLKYDETKGFAFFNFVFCSSSIMPTIK